jgi:hypothetical protein
MPAESGPREPRIEERGRSGRKKPRRKRKKIAPADGRPAFAAAYPRHPDVDRLLQAFEAGNFAYVRAEAPRVMERSDGAVREAARDLRRRIDADPTSVFLWGLGVALLVFLYGYYLAR